MHSSKKLIFKIILFLKFNLSGMVKPISKRKIFLELYHNWPSAQMWDENEHFFISNYRYSFSAKWKQLKPKLIKTKKGYGRRLLNKLILPNRKIGAIKNIAHFDKNLKFISFIAQLPFYICFALPVEHRSWNHNGVPPPLWKKLIGWFLMVDVNG